MKTVTVFVCQQCGNVAANLPDWCECPSCGQIMQMQGVTEIEISQTMKKLEIEK